jgi:hypothetical protein
MINSTITTLLHMAKGSSFQKVRIMYMSSIDSISVIEKE